MADINIDVIKDSNINNTDQIGGTIYDLNSPNTIKDGVILLYIYYLRNMPLHGYKVGMTKCKINETFWHAIKTRISNQEKELILTEEDYKKYGDERVVQFWGICLKDDDTDFKDHTIHRRIMSEIPNIAEKENEWFSGTNLTIEKIIEIFKDYRDSTEEPYEIYTPRKEQKEAIEKMKDYFASDPVDKRFLLNCKMRFGKCFTVYKYAEETHKRKVLILTFVPAVQDEWNKNRRHIRTKYDYFTDSDLKRNDFQLDNNSKKPYIVFLSLQNYLGSDSETKETKDKIRKLQSVDFDLLVLDEYHFGAWNDRTQETIEDLDKKYEEELEKTSNQMDLINRFNITVDETLCLSGTPFKALDRGDFNDDNTYSYSYFDEQRNKYPKSEDGNFNEINKEYEHFPDMKIYGYNMASLFDSNIPFLADMMRSDKSLNTDHKFFSLNTFFQTERDKDCRAECKFVYEEQIISWLNTLKGAKYEDKFNFPFTYKTINDVNQSLWLLPTVNACVAMKKLLDADDYYSQFEIINLSNPKVGAGVRALNVLKDGMNKAKLSNKLGTISLTVNKLTLGVTVEQWNAVFVLKDLSSPESYFQSIFRIQTPLVVDGEIKKKVCKVYDFNIDRAASLLLKYAEKTNEQSVTKLEIADLIVKYMPIYLNGDVNTPIAKDVFYELAEFGDTSGQPLSKKITNTSRTTHADDQTITDMLNDEECLAVVNKVFAHAKFGKTKARTYANGDEERNEVHKKSEYKKGLDVGYNVGERRYKDFADLDYCQDALNEAIELLFKETVPSEYSHEQQAWYQEGVADGYLKGVNAPVKKMQCGAGDGIKFIDVIKNELGENIKYKDEGKAKINNLVNAHLNDVTNIPLEYRGQIYKKCYCDSFRAAVKNGLSDPPDPDKQKSVEDVDNVLKHILARLFQFLYISVYRETSFNEIFSNANPDVFLSAVGITKEEFQTLNKYHIFQENVLDRYIHEFFVNETLGKSLSNEEKENQFYRNSFNWFGFGVEN